MALWVLWKKATLPFVVLLRIVKQAIETEDKEHVIDLLQEMAVKHKKEKEKLTKTLEEKTASYEALSKVNEQKSKALDKVNTELEKVKKRISVMSPKDMGESLREEAQQLVSGVELEIRGSFYSALKALAEHQETSGIDHSALMAGYMAQIKKAINEIAIEFDIQTSINDDPTPDFLREDAMEQAISATEKAQQEAGL